MTQDTEDVVAHTVHCAKVHKANFVCTCGADLAAAESTIQSLSDRIDVLEGLLVKYGDRVRMATAWPESVQPAIDEAFANVAARAALHQEGITKS